MYIAARHESICNKEAITEIKLFTTKEKAEAWAAKRSKDAYEYWEVIESDDE